LKRVIKKEHIDRLKENLDGLSVLPMIGEYPGGLRYQKTLGEWEGGIWSYMIKKEERKVVEN